MATRGYHSYRGRRTLGQWVLIILLILVLLVACGVIFLQPYISYADDGGIYLNLPGVLEADLTALLPSRQTTGGDSSTGEDDQQQVNLVVGEDDQTGQADQIEQADPDVVTETYGEHHLVELSDPASAQGSLSQLLAQAGANGFVITVRDNTGRVTFAAESAISTATAAATVTREDLTELCRGEDSISVARLNCFHDSYYAWYDSSVALLQSGGKVWQDERSYYWLDPAKEDARAYVVGLASECAQLGFEELLLEDLCYPASGDLSKITASYSTQEKTQALVTFLAELREALADYNVKLALQLDSKLLDAASSESYIEASGVDLAQLLPMVDAVYVDRAYQSAARSALAAAGAADTPLVVVTSGESDAENWLQTS
jgi:hypothetical protein